MTNHLASSVAESAKPDLLVELLPYFTGMLGAMAVMVITMLITVRMPAGPKRSLIETSGISVSVVLAVAFAALALPLIMNG